MKLELHEVMYPFLLVLGTKSRFFAGAVGTLNHQVRDRPTWHLKCGPALACSVLLYHLLSTKALDTVSQQEALGFKTPTCLCFAPLPFLSLYFINYRELSPLPAFPDLSFAVLILPAIERKS